MPRGHSGLEDDGWGGLGGVPHPARLERARVFRVRVQAGAGTARAWRAAVDSGRARLHSHETLLTTLKPDSRVTFNCQRFFCFFPNRLKGFKSILKM